MSAHHPQTRSLHLSLPKELGDNGPCTPTYEFPVTLPPNPGTDTLDMSTLSLGQPLTPSPRMTGKRDRGAETPQVQEEPWAEADLQLLQNVLDRPPKQALYAPGSMPPPQILDELTTAIVTQCGHGPEPSSAAPGQEEAGEVDGEAMEEMAETELEPEGEAESLVHIELADDMPTMNGTCANEFDDGRVNDPSQGPGDGYDASAEPSPNPSGPVSRVPSPLPTPGWSHSWEETRRMLTTLALADTRLGQAREERKLTRQERLARPGIKRVTSMDFLDDAGSDSQPSEKIGRVLRLSTQLQNSIRETVALARAASFGSPGASPTTTVQTPVARTTTQTHRSTPPVSFNRSFPHTPSPKARPSLMRRQSSGRSDRSTRAPSLLVRGRSFTASDLEAEVEAEMRQVASEPISNAASAGNLVDQVSPRTPCAASFEPPTVHSNDTSPRRHSSSPEMAAGRLMRSHSYSAASSRREPRPEPRITSQDYGGPGRQSLGLGLPPAPVHFGEQSLLLAPAFDAEETVYQARLDSEWDSDSDRSDRDGVVSVKRRARPPTSLAMTVMAGMQPPGAPAPSGDRPPKLVIDHAMTSSAGEVSGLRSPFEERPME